MSSLRKLALASLLLSFSFAPAQTPDTPPVPPPDPIKDQNTQTPRKITPEEAKELFQGVDELLKFVSIRSGLPIKSEVKSQIADRDSVQKYVEEKMAEDEDQKRLERAEVVLKKLGLLPREFRLRTFLVEVLREQVAGFYDSKRKTMFLLDHMAPEAQRPVIVHELTHALQDQKIDLDKWVKEVRDKAKKASHKDEVEAEMDEQLGARTALLEGQGMVMLLDHMVSPSGRTLLEMPQFVEFAKLNMAANDASPILKSAPLLLRESLIFPYRDGLGFVYALLASGGKDAAFSQALSNPPRDTRQILEPKSYLQKETIAPLRLPELNKELGKNYERYDAGSVGQFDVGVLIREFSGPMLAKELAPSWRGGIYYAARRKSAKKDEELTTADIGIAYLSRWATADDAKKFADMYGDSLKRRYSRAVSNGEGWNTEEGPVKVRVIGEHLLVLEGFETPTADKIYKAIANSLKNGSGKKVASSSLGMKVAAPVFAAREQLLHGVSH